eukprot:5168856-Pyramimonas_sp.AAC.1
MLEDITNKPKVAKFANTNNAKGKSAYKWEHLYDGFKDAKEARSMLSDLTGAHWKRKTPHGKGGIYSCATHANCPALARVSEEQGGTWRLDVEGSLSHYDTLIPASNERKGIAKRHLQQVDKLLVEHQGAPQFVANQFILDGSYKFESLEKGDNKADLPSGLQCKERLRILKKQMPEKGLPRPMKGSLGDSGGQGC